MATGRSIMSIDEYLAHVKVQLEKFEIHMKVRYPRLCEGTDQYVLSLNDWDGQLWAFLDD